jgi:hypothetical protein
MTKPQLTRVNAQGVRERQDDLEAWILDFPDLDGADVGLGDAGFLGERDLGQFRALAGLAKGYASHRR